jgi:tryptophan-rich sensory protein
MTLSFAADAAGLVLSLGAAFAAAFIGSLATRRGLRGWYQTLRKPSWTPPGGVIGLVWSVLYVLMAVAAWLVWRQAGLWSAPLGPYAAQLALNVAWSVVFFGRRDPATALGTIALLWLAIVATLAAFAPWSPLAAWLLVPYLAWVTFASYLNARVWRMNQRTPAPGGRGQASR